MRYEKTPQGLGDMLAGVSYGLGAMLPASILMLRWFSSRRGTAIGICAAGTGISAVVFSPILSALIERFSLRVCFYFEALVSLLAAGLVFLLIRESPEACCAAIQSGNAAQRRRAESVGNSFFIVSCSKQTASTASGKATAAEGRIYQPSTWIFPGFHLSLGCGCSAG